MRWIMLCSVLGLLTQVGCDSGIPRDRGGEAAVAAAAFPGVAAGSASETEDTLPIVIRRAWYTNSSDIWSGPSADGRLLPITDWSGEGSGGAVAVHDLLTGSTRRVTPEANPFPDGYAENSAISPDGRSVAYAWWSDERGWELRVMDLGGTEPRVLHHDPAFEVMPRQWSSDGRQILVFGVDNRDNFIGLVSVEDGALEVLKELGQRHPVGVSLSPDGRYVVYDDDAEGRSQRDVFLITTSTKEVRRLVEHPADDLVFGWDPGGGHVLFASDRTGTMGAWLLPVAEGEADGPPTLVKPELWRAEPLGFDGQGSFYYVVWMNMSDVFLATLDPETGQLLDQPARVSSQYMGSNGGPEWSPDGSQLAYFSERKRWRQLGREVIVIRSTETGEEKELHPALGSYMHPRWSPDGRSLLVRARDEAGHGFFRIDIQTGVVEPLIRFPEGSGNIASRAEWIENGRSLLYWWPPASVAEGYIPEDDRAHFTLRARELETGNERIVFEGGVSPRFAVSPDGRQVAIGAERNGRAALMIMPATGGQATVVAADAGEASNLSGLPAEIQWSPDGRFLYFARNDGRSFWRVPVSGGEMERLGWGEDLQVSPFFRMQPGGSRIALALREGEGGGEVWVMEDFLPGPEENESGRRAP